MEKIRVVALVNDIRLGGTESVLLGVASRIDRKEFDFSLCALTDFRGTSHVTLDASFREANVAITYLVEGKTSFPRIKHVFRLVAYLRTSRPDILHCCLPDAVIIGTLAGRIAGVKNIIIHEQNTHRFYSRKLDVLFGIARYFSKLTICYSEALQEELFGTVQPQSSMVIYNGIDTEKIDAAKSSVVHEQKRNELGVASTDTVILAASRLTPWKGHAFLIRAFGEIAARFPDAKLLIAGEGEQEVELKKMAETPQLGSAVRFLGARTDVAEIMAVSDIFSYAIEGSNAVGALTVGMSAMEALAASLPTIISDYPDRHLRLLDRENCMVVKPGDVDSLSRALAYLLESTEERRRIGRNARTFVDSYFSLKQTIPMYESVYRALVHRHRSKR